MEMIKAYHKYALILLLLFISGEAIAYPTQTACSSDPIPDGWVVTSEGWNPATCNSPPPLFGQSNVVTFTDISNLPLNTQIGICPNTPVPQGWTTNNAQGGLVCGCPYAVGPGGCTSQQFEPAFIWIHTVCTAPPSPGSCPPPPPPPTGSISASPMTVVVPYGQSRGTTQVSFTSANTSGTCIWVSTNGNAPSLWSCGGASGSNLVWPYVPAGGNSKFLLTTSNLVPSPVLNTATVTGFAGAQPTVNANPASIVVPYGALSGGTTVNWNAPGYSSIDWCGKINGGSWQFSGLTTAGSGSAGVAVPPGTTYGYRVYAHGNASECGTTGMLASATVTATQGAQPTFTASPSHVIVPRNGTSGTFTLAWNAPGYQSLDIVGQTNGGAWGAPFNISASGNIGINITVGTNYNYRFYPHGDTAHLLGTASVTASY